MVGLSHNDTQMASLIRSQVATVVQSAKLEAEEERRRVNPLKSKEIAQIINKKAGLKTLYLQ